MGNGSLRVTRGSFRPPWLGGLVIALASAVFAFDTLPIDQAVFATTYVVAFLAAIGQHGSRFAPLLASLCVGLTLAAFGLAHGFGSETSSSVRCVVAVTAIVATTEMLLRRRYGNLARRAVSEGQAELELLTGASPQIVYRMTADGTVDFLSQRWTSLTGQPTDEAVREQGWLKRVHPDDVVRMEAGIEEARILGQQFRMHYRVRHHDGSYKWLLTVANPHRLSSAAEVSRWYGAAIEVDAEFRANEAVRRTNATLEQKVAERTRDLMRSEERYRSIFEQTHVAFFEQDCSALATHASEGHAADAVGDGHPPDEGRNHTAEYGKLLKVTHVNAALIRLIGENPLGTAHGAGTAFPPPELTSRIVTAVFRREHRFEDRIRFATAGGERIVALVGGFFLENDRPLDRLICGMVDVTGFEQAQERLLAAQEKLARANRIATLGALSASIAHELNQPLGALVTDAQTCLRWLKRGDPEAASAAAERLVSSANRASEIVRRTRDRFGKSQAEPPAVNLVQLVQETRTLLERELAAGAVRLILQPVGDIPLVRAEPVELQQVLINLVINGIDAMRTTDKSMRILRISVEAVTTEAVRTIVSDNGPGIPEEVADNIFDPLFTTKPEGMGMGLAICRAIVEGLGGEMGLLRRDGAGATFGFTLPTA